MLGVFLLLPICVFLCSSFCKKVTIPPTNQIGLYKNLTVQLKDKKNTTINLHPLFFRLFHRETCNKTLFYKAFPWAIYFLPIISIVIINGLFHPVTGQ